MLKYAGLLLIFVCFTLGGNALVIWEKDKIACQDGMILLIRSIRQGAAYFREPLGKIYPAFSCRVLEKNRFKDVLCEKGLKDAFSACRDCFGYDDFTADQVLSFAERLGRLPLEEQLASCDRLLEVLEAYSGEMKKSFPKKNKLYKTLGMTLGIGVVILLL